MTEEMIVEETLMKEIVKDITRLVNVLKEIDLPQNLKFAANC